MKKKLRFWLAFLMLSCSARFLGAQTPVTVKTDLADIAFRKTGLEVECRMGAESRWSIALQGGVMGAFWRSAETPRVYGWFLRGGPKYDVGEAIGGLTLQPELIFAAWNDPDPYGFNVVATRVRNMGAFLNVAYPFLIRDRLLIEPFAGSGFMVTISKSKIGNDSGLGDPEPFGPYRTDPYQNMEFTRFGLSLVSNIQLNFGLKIGVRLK